MNYLDDLQLGGFDFDNCKRNEFLMNKGDIKEPKTTKTGTTIVGLVFKDGVVLGADTRASAGPIVADKNCSKIHYLAPNIYCCGAGTAADTEAVTHMIETQLKLHRLQTGLESRCSTAQRKLQHYLFRYGGHIGAALIVGGFDPDGPHLISISPDGCANIEPFTTMGSGCLAAMSIMEQQYKDNLTEEEAKAIVVKSIEAGIYHDLGSGSNVDICVLKKGKTEYFRNYVKQDKSQYEREKKTFTFAKGTTPVLKEIHVPLSKLVEVTEEKMEVV